MERVKEDTRHTYTHTLSLFYDMHTHSGAHLPFHNAIMEMCRCAVVFFISFLHVVCWSASNRSLKSVKERNLFPSSVRPLKGNSSVDSSSFCVIGKCALYFESSVPVVAFLLEFFSRSFTYLSVPNYPSRIYLSANDDATMHLAVSSLHSCLCFVVIP